MEEHRDALERMLAGKLGDYSQQPPPDLFARIAASTEQARAAGPVRGIRIVRHRRRSLAGVRTAIAVAALFAIGVFVTLRQAARIGQTTPEMTAAMLAARIDPITELPGVGTFPDGEAGASAHSAPQRSAVPPAGKRTVHAKQEFKRGQAAAGKDARTAGPVSAIHEAAATQGTAARETPVATQPASSSSAPVSGAATQETVPGEGARIQQRWERIMAQAQRPKRRARTGWTASLYAANYGIGDAEAISAGIRDAGLLTVGHQEDAVIPDGSLGMTMSAPARNPEAMKYDHRVPVTFGIGVSYPFSRRFSLESGLSYTFLCSESRRNGDFGYTLTQDLHYVGIPLSVAWSFTGRRPLDVYVRGGGMIEKSVYATRTKVYTGPQAVGRERECIHVKGVQFSLHAALGVSYTFGNRLGIYFEPGAAYYMEKGSQPVSYRTEHPVSLSLRAGVRIMLR